MSTGKIKIMHQRFTEEIKGKKNGERKVRRDELKLRYKKRCYIGEQAIGIC